MHLIERLRRDHQRVRDNIGLQLREWSSAVVASAVFGGVIAVCWAAIALMVTGAAATDVVQGLGRAVGYFLLTWSAAVALFVVRGLVIGLSDNIAMAEERAKRWTLAAAGVAMTVLVFLVISSPAAAADLMPSSKPADGPPDYCARDLGTWFYCVRPEAPPEETEQVAKPEASSEAKEVAEFEKFKVELDRVQKLAVWNPTPENVERFYRMQRAALNQSSLFSDQYRRLVWARPDPGLHAEAPGQRAGQKAVVRPALDRPRTLPAEDLRRYRTVLCLSRDVRPVPGVQPDHEELRRSLRRDGQGDLHRRSSQRLHLTDRHGPGPATGLGL
jgi:conjugal transfer pilus assembly protein TraF